MKNKFSFLLKAEKILSSGIPFSLMIVVVTIMMLGITMDVLIFNKNISTDLKLFLTFVTSSLLFVATWYVVKPINPQKKHKAKIKCPKELKHALHQYLFFFKEYIKSSKGEIVDLTIEETDEGLVIFTNKKDTTKINAYLTEYIDILKTTDEERITINVTKEDATEREIDILILKTKLERDNFKRRAEIAQLENHHLKQHNEFLKTLSLQFAGKETTINNLFINDGEQQIADRVVNEGGRE